MKWYLSSQNKFAFFNFISAFNYYIMEASYVVVDKNTTEAVDENLEPVFRIFEVPSEGEVWEVNVEKYHQKDMAHYTNQKLVETVRSKHLVSKDDCKKKPGRNLQQKREEEGKSWDQVDANIKWTILCNMMISHWPREGDYGNNDGEA